MEKWASITALNNDYSVSSEGRVRRNRILREVISESNYRGERRHEMTREYPEQILGTQKTIHGYLKVQARSQGKRSSLSVHRLVADAFIPNPEGLPVVNHKDGDKTNNHVSNLEWCSYQDNSLHALSTGLSHCKSKRARILLSNREVLTVRVLYLVEGKTSAQVAGILGLPTSIVWPVVSWFRYPDIGVCLKNADKFRDAQKINTLVVHEIRRLHTKFLKEGPPNKGPRELARVFGLSYGTLQDIVRLRLWADTPAIRCLPTWYDVLKDIRASGLPNALITFGDKALWVKYDGLPSELTKRFYRVYLLPRTTLMPCPEFLTGSIQSVPEGLFVRGGINPAKEVAFVKVYQYDPSQGDDLDWLLEREPGTVVS